MSEITYGGIENMNYYTCGTIIAGIILFAPAISLIIDLIVEKVGKLWNKNTK